MIPCKACGVSHRIEESHDTIACEFCETPTPIRGEGSIAQVFTSDNPDAPTQICMACGMAMMAEDELRRQYARDEVHPDETEDAFVRMMRVPARLALEWWAEEGGLEAARKHLSIIVAYHMRKDQAQN